MPQQDGGPGHCLEIFCGYITRRRSSVNEGLEDSTYTQKRFTGKIDFLGSEAADADSQQDLPILAKEKTLGVRCH